MWRRILKTGGEQAFLAGAFLLAIVMRLLPWHAVRVNGDFLFSQSDTYYHLRRATLYAKTFPAIPAIDPYMAYPLGAECPWPPLYDLAVAGLATLAGGGTASPESLRALFALLPVLLGALTTIPVYLLARRLGGKIAAVVAALLLAIFPYHMIYSAVGAGDHHAAEVCLFAWYLHLFLSAVADDGPRPSRARAAGAGVVLGAAVLVWQGSIVFGCVLAGGLYSWLLALAYRRKGVEPPRPPKEVIDPAFVCMGTAFLVTSAGRIGFPSATAQTRFDFGYFSWFQPAALLIAAGCIALLSLATGNRPGARDLRRRFGYATSGVLVLAGLLLLIPGFRINLAEGIGILLTRNAWLQSIQEFQPTFRLSAFDPPYSWMSVESGLTVLEFLLPAAFSGYLAVRECRKGVPRFGTALFAFWSILFGVLALRQYRWANAYSINIAIGIGMLVSMLHARTADRWEGTRRRRIGPAAASIAAALVLTLPQTLFLKDYLPAPGLFLLVPFDNSLLWLRDNTPKTRGLWNPGEQPEYSVVSYWNFGHIIQYYGERPTVANNFGYQLRGGGLEDTFRILLAKDEDTMAELCARRGVRYLFLTDIWRLRAEGYRLIGVDFEREYVGAEGEKRFMSLPYSRLFYGDAGAFGISPTRFRLIHESHSEPRNPFVPTMLEDVRIYEFVKGAVVEGVTRPNGMVALFGTFRSDMGRVFSYATIAAADRQGRFSARYPYATGGRNYGTTSLRKGFARADSGRTVFFDVTEDDVLLGRSIRLDLR